MHGDTTRIAEVEPDVDIHTVLVRPMGTVSTSARARQVSYGEARPGEPPGNLMCDALDKVHKFRRSPSRIFAPQFHFELRRSLEFYSTEEIASVRPTEGSALLDGRERGTAVGRRRGDHRFTAGARHRAHHARLTERQRWRPDHPNQRCAREPTRTYHYHQHWTLSHFDQAVARFSQLIEVLRRGRWIR